MQDACITSHASPRAQGGEMGGTEFLGNGKEITVYAAVGGGAGREGKVGS